MNTYSIQDLQRNATKAIQEYIELTDQAIYNNYINVLRSNNMSNYEKGEVKILRNVELKWVKVDPANPDEYKGSRKWQADVLLTDELAQAMTDEGFNVKEKDGQKFIRVVKKCVTGAGKPQSPPYVVERDGRTPGTTNIGNGTLANVKVFCKKYDVGTFVSIYLEGIQLLELAQNLGFDDVDADDKQDVPF